MTNQEFTTLEDVLSLPLNKIKSIEVIPIIMMSSNNFERFFERFQNTFLAFALRNDFRKYYETDIEIYDDLKSLFLHVLPKWKGNSALSTYIFACVKVYRKRFWHTRPIDANTMYLPNYTLEQEFDVESKPSDFWEEVEESWNLNEYEKEFLNYIGYLNEPSKGKVRRLTIMSITSYAYRNQIDKNKLHEARYTFTRKLLNSRFPHRVEDIIVNELHLIKHRKKMTQNSHT